MLNQISKLSLLVVFAIAMMFTACEKENIELTDNFTIGEEIAADSRGGDRGNRGNRGNGGSACYSLVYPVSIAFADGTTVEVADKAAAKEATKAWKEANPDATERPSLVFPVSIDQDGEVTSIADQEALMAVREACGGERGNRGRRGACFSLVYPVSIAFADGTTVEVADRAAAKEAKKAWKEANPDATERPSLVFPVSIDQDGEVTSIADQEALMAAREACGGQRGSRGSKGGRGGKGGHGGKGASCFQPVFPITLMIDGVATTIEDRAGKRAALAAWKEANPDATERPTVELGFPVTVELEDETTATINSEEELDALKESCDGEGDEG